MCLSTLRSWFVASVIASSGAGCAHAGPGAGAPRDPAAVRAAIGENLARFSGAMKRADAAAIASLFTEDAVYMSSAKEGFVTGRPAIQALFAARFQAARFLEVTIATASVQVEGDAAYELGTNRLTVQTGDAPPVTRTGRYLTIWKLQPDGAWRIHRDALVPDPAP
ncbi:SgcJ/EcaC family oxidoreductase [Anaeromyxobacter sp. PSR-1]|uniref:YybH family protein n=1 Tax=Anaeromyxobacter sp. PSR-1 TaxID=1300915 RepID=UPI0005E4B397|nr:SgcJ/EcaC family oxidoreductase [Anaeromyxobacter sp. PSR-1]GAO01199.1 snoaL-like domain protein [Anaeromyxobacter sp. PSR-1]